MLLAVIGLLAIFIIMLLPLQDLQNWQEKLLNPGKVSQAHYLLQGKRITCGECHPLGRKITNKDCQRCHTKDWFASKGKFYEKTHQKVSKKPCLECHLEHQGYDAKISKPFRTQEHKTLPLPEREDCKSCHRQQALMVHPDNINLKCKECHDYEQWSRQAMDHVSIKPKKVPPSSPYFYCKKCHLPGFHYTGSRNPDPLTECKPCHHQKETRPDVLPPGY